MGKIAFCFPGQGALEDGMGRELAEAVPAAMEVYRVGSEASGLDLQKLCFDSPLEDLVPQTDLKALYRAALSEVNRTSDKKKK